jgi:hypothetical protein
MCMCIADGRCGAASCTAASAPAPGARLGSCLALHGGRDRPHGVHGGGRAVVGVRE